MGRSRGCVQGGIDHGIGIEQWAALAQNAVDHARRPSGQFVFLQLMAWTYGVAKPKERANYHYEAISDARSAQGSTGAI